MCVLVVNNGTKISLEDFRAMYDTNPDGVGIMWNEKGVSAVFQEKHMIPDESALDKWYHGVYSPIKENPEAFNICVHFRFATDGDIVINNNHPFGFTDKSGNRCYAMHNGIMSDRYRGYSIWTKIVSSDTANFVNDYLSNRFEFTKEKLNVQKTLEINRELEYSKMVVLSPSGNLHIFNESLGKWQGDNWYSHLRWNYSRTYKDNYLKF